MKQQRQPVGASQKSERQTVLDAFLRRLLLLVLLMAAFVGRATAQGSDPAFVIYSGSYYLAHEYVTNEGEPHFRLVAQTEFNANCIWYSTISGTAYAHNYYFLDQDGTTKLYLYATFEANGSLNYARIVADNQPTDVHTITETALIESATTDVDLAYFYDWDWGLARGIHHSGQDGNCPSTFNSPGSECWESYWLVYDGSWHLSSVSSYDPVDNYAQFRRVYPIVNHSVTAVTSEGGIGNLAESYTLHFGESQELTVTATDYTAHFIPAYTTYTVKDLECNDASWALRHCDSIAYIHNFYGGMDNGNSIPDAEQVEYEGQDITYRWELSGDGAAYLSFTTGDDAISLTSTAAAPTVYYRLHNYSGDKTATLTLEATYPNGLVQTRTATIIVVTECGNPPQDKAPVVTYDGVTISWLHTTDAYQVRYRIKNAESPNKWSNTARLGDVHEYSFTELEYNTTYEYQVGGVCNDAIDWDRTDNVYVYEFTTKAEPRLLIGGSVFGGGRMADVGGNTAVYIVNCDNVSAVYGGNDIAGQVTGGSKVVIGINDGQFTENPYGVTNATIHIPSVYGGGNGYYKYGSQLPDPAVGTTMFTDRQFSGGVTDVDGSTSYLASGYIPSINKTAVTVSNDFVKIDSLFGGAKNAFVTTATDTATSITINGGTIFSVFGGNNYGGKFETGVFHHLVVNNTKTLSPHSSTHLGGDHTTGLAVTDDDDEHGICYLFGGGNKVGGKKVHIEFHGGQVDTLFGGGNQATVDDTKIHLNCSTIASIITEAVYRNQWLASHDADYQYMTAEEKTNFWIQWNLWGSDEYNAELANQLQAKADSANINYYYDWNGTHTYNIRTLFGGNNAADMSALPVIELQGGHVGTVYGGGNAGRMLANVTDNSFLDYDNQEIHYSTYVKMDDRRTLVDYLYGGCQKSDVVYGTRVEVKRGHVGTVYGGCNISGDVGSTKTQTTQEQTDVPDYYQVQGGTWVVASGGNVYKNVFGGSNGYYHCSNDVYYIDGIDYDDAEHYYLPTDANSGVKTSIPTHNETHVRIEGTAIVHGNVYAGGNLANVGFPGSYYQNMDECTLKTDKSYPILCGWGSVRMTGGKVARNVYGGGNMASIYGLNEVIVSGGEIAGALYGGNDRAGRVAQFNGRLAAHTLASDGHTPTSSFETYVELKGNPKVGTVYGGGNGDYDYTENSELQFCNPSGVIDAIKPIQGSTFVDIHINGGSSDEGGYIGTVYGGGDGVTVDGSITVFLNTDASPAGFDNVGRIFGGNNKGDLNTVPYIVLLKGQVGTVYGGCNQGQMTGMLATTFNGNHSLGVDNLGSYVWLRNNYRVGGVDYPTDAVVSDAVYGGCRLGNVSYNSMVYVDGGNHEDVRIFGGNDISGSIGTLSGQTYVFVEDGTVNEIYGGGNGDYTYTANGDIYKGSVLVASGPDFGRPYCSETLVQLNGGIAKGNVYAGGLAGDCGDTRLLVEGTTIIHGDLFGGGRGAVENIGLSCNRVGNVGLTTTVDLVSCSTASTGRHVYGGGHNGDVGDVTLNLYETFQHPLNAIYGGCVASDARDVVMNINGWEGSTVGNGYIVDTLYGGNDFSGRVEKTVMNVNSGKFYTAFGAGNGDYVYDDYIEDLKSRMTVVVDGTPVTSATQPTLHTGAGDPGVGEYADKSKELCPPQCSIRDYYIVWTSATENETTTWTPHYHFWKKVVAECDYDTVPYSMEVEMNINGGEFFYSVYGGGNMGLVGDRDMDANAMQAFNDAEGTYAETSESYNSERIDHMGLIVMNVHGGNFHRHIFAGASGRPGIKGQYFGSRFFESTHAPSTAQFTTGNPTNVDGGAIGHQLVYGTKIINMDGGHVEFSVYGGSESVDDGFPYECFGRKNPNLYTGFPNSATVYMKNDHKTASMTTFGNDDAAVYEPGNIYSTQRPSSIINIVGGIVDKSVYGGGYQGNIYGSVYVNIGLHAVDDSPVWTTSYGATDPVFVPYEEESTEGYYIYSEDENGTAEVPEIDNNGYPLYDENGVMRTKIVAAPMAKYKPNLSNLSGHAEVAGRPTLTMNSESPVMLNASVYNASDWGEAGDKAYFNTRGVFGGVTNILVDGRGYYTGNPEHSLMPAMNIAHSLIGAGTSTEGGDINRLITLRHYGSYYQCPELTRDLSSIQRADKVILDSVFINLNGEQDAFSAFVSPNYSLCRLDTVIMRRDNIVALNAPGIYIGHWVSMKDTVEVTNFTLFTNNQATTLADYDALVDGNKLYTNFMKQNTIANGGLDNHNLTYANDFFDNLQNFHRTGVEGQAYNVDDHGCAVPFTDNGREIYNHCSALTQCARLRSERGHGDVMGAFNTLVLNNGSYLKISPYVDLLDESDKNNVRWYGENGGIMDGIDDNGHAWGHVYGWMYLVALDETQSYVYAANKALSPAANVTDGGFISTCDCNNIWTGSIPGSQLRDAAGAVHDSWELNYININATTTVLQPYRIWKVGQNRGTRKRHITLVANAKPDRILNYDINTNDDHSPTYLNMDYMVVDDASCTGSGTNSHVTTTGANSNPVVSHLPHNVTNTAAEGQTPVLSVPNRAALANESYQIDYNTTKNHSQYSYAITTLELPPSNAGNFYVMTAPVIDLDNGGQLKLTDQAYVHKPDVDKHDVIFQASDLYAVDANGNYILEGDSLKIKSARTGMGEILNNPNYTFGLAFTTDYSGSNFNTEGNWIDEMGTADLQHINDSVARNNTGRTILPCHLDWATSYISGNEFLSAAGGYVSKTVAGAEGTIPSMSFTLTYSRDISTTITRDITFTLEEYTSTGQYVGPVEVTVTINTVISEMDNLRADLLAMYNEGISNEYVRKITIPATFVQRDLYIEGIEWDIAYPAKTENNVTTPSYDPYSAGITSDEKQAMAKYMFNLVDTTTGAYPYGNVDDDNRHFSLVINPSENMSERLTNHLGWYNIQTHNVDLFKMAYDDRTNNESNYYNAVPSSIEDFRKSSEAGGASNKYNSLNIDGNGKKSYMGSGGRSTGLLLGTLDGRSSAALDVRLLFNGMSVYEKYFPEPLGIVKLKMHWYNNKISQEDIANNVQTDGEFYIYIRLRTRDQGDTIYMAWGDEMRNNYSKPRYYYDYRDGNGEYHTGQEVTYDANGDPVTTGLSDGVTLYKQYYPYIQRNVVGTDGNVLNNTAGHSLATVHSFEWQLAHNSSEYTNLDDVATVNNVKNNPDAYLRTFEQVMKIYQEGDVIDILQTIPVGDASTKNAQAISGADYSVIQIIRYSGSHFKFPSLGCANYDPLVEVTGNLTMRNVWFNGSGFTRVKKPLGSSTVRQVVSSSWGNGWCPIEEGTDANDTVGNGNYSNKYIRYGYVDGNYKRYIGASDNSGTVVNATDEVPLGYYEAGMRERVVLPVHAPIIYVHKGGSVNFSANVTLSNNLNFGEPARKPRYEYRATDDDPIVLKYYTYHPTTYHNSHSSELPATHIPGGAIAIIKDTVAFTPEVSLGTLCNIYDNVVVDPSYNSKNTDRTSALNTNVNRNSGAGVYVYGGHFYLGSSNYTATNTIEHNYYAKTSDHTSMLSGAPNYFRYVETRFMADTAGTGDYGAFNSTDGTVTARITNGKKETMKKYTPVYNSETEEYTFEEQEKYVYSFYLDTTGTHAQNLSLNNVQLTRVYNRDVHPYHPVRIDGYNDMIYFRGALSQASRVGVSKWFPGYVYNNHGAYHTNVYDASLDANNYLGGNHYHQLWDSIPRDTIGVARLTTGATVMAGYVYDSTVFFNDSVYSPTTGSGTQPSFALNTDYLVNYGLNGVGNPNFDDHVYMFHHDYLDPKIIYFQRCASFGKGVSQKLLRLAYWDVGLQDSVRFTVNDYALGDSIAYHWNKDATCVASTDSIMFRVGGGFFPYSYHWDMDSIVYERHETLANYSGSALGTADQSSNYLALKRIPVKSRTTFGSNQIADLTSARFEQLRARASVDTLVLNHLHMRQQLIKSTYMYECTATDLTGRCAVSQPVMVRVGKLVSGTEEQTGRGHSGNYYVDSLNFLRHRNPYAAYENYVDEYGDQDHPGYYTEKRSSTGDFISVPGTDDYQSGGNIEVVLARGTSFYKYDQTATENFNQTATENFDDSPAYKITTTTAVDKAVASVENGVTTWKYRAIYVTDQGGIGYGAWQPTEDAARSSETPENCTRMNHYLYYRVQAAGVDSSSFHDKVLWAPRKTYVENHPTSPSATPVYRDVFFNNNHRKKELSGTPAVNRSYSYSTYDRLGNPITVQCTKIDSTFSVRSADYLVPYVRPLVLVKEGDVIRRKNPVLSDVNYDNPDYRMRDTLGFELRHFDSTVTITVYVNDAGAIIGRDTVGVLNEVHRHLWNKVSDDDVQKGIYSWIWNPSVTQDRPDLDVFSTEGYSGTDADTVDFLPLAYVPHHTHGGGPGSASDAGIRRAGYSHNHGHWYNHGLNRGTLEERVEARKFAGKPYHDKVMMDRNGLGDVRYVRETGSVDANNSPYWADDADMNAAGKARLYASEMVPRYLRVYRSYKIDPHIVATGKDPGVIEREYPSGDGASIWAFETSETAFNEANKLDLSTTEFCPGGVVNLHPVHENGTTDETINRGVDSRSVNPTGKWEYMAWDFDPSSQENTGFVVSADPTKNSPVVYYAPGDYWHEVVHIYRDLGHFDYNINEALEYAYERQQYALNDDMTERSISGLSDEQIAKRNEWHQTAFNLGPNRTYTYNGKTIQNDYYEDYYGDITIFTNKGLAWLVSKVNGFNNQAAQTYRFNTIRLDFDEVDMSAHKWLPLGNRQNNFEGLIKAQDTTLDANEEPVPPTYPNPKVKNLTVNERNLPFVGMFGYTDHAKIRDFTISNAFVRSNMYVGGLVGWADSSTTIRNMEIKQNSLFGEYIIGGIAARTSSETKIQGNKISNPRMYGNAIYAGQGVGRMSETTFENNSLVFDYDDDPSTVDIDPTMQNMSAIFYYDPQTNFTSVSFGGAAGLVDGDNSPAEPTSGERSGLASRLFGKRGAKSVAPSVINNNYVQINGTVANLNAGGLVGVANNVSINNNYVYGLAGSATHVGGLVGVSGTNVSISNSYFVNGMAKAFVGQDNGVTPLANTATFSGQGNRVQTSVPIDGRDNLTRVLNKWVDQNGGSSTYLHWRSDLDNVNSGYPIFGTPDLIPVEDSAEVATCDSYDLDGLLLTESGRYVFHWVDSTEYVDSIFTLNLTITYGDTTELTDTVLLGQSYNGNGINLSAEQVEALFGTDRSLEVVTMRHVDSLLNANGCDSLVTLTLYIVNNDVSAPEVIETLSDVRLYPNPTLGTVYVEGFGLRSVEVYDNVSRTLLRLGEKELGDNSTKTSFDLSNYPAGAYYVRIRTSRGTVVKKVIKK